MIRTWLNDFTLGRQVRKITDQIVLQERFAGAAPTVILPLISDREGEIELVLRRPQEPA